MKTLGNMIRKQVAKDIGEYHAAALKLKKVSGEGIGRQGRCAGIEGSWIELSLQGNILTLLSNPNAEEKEVFLSLLAKWSLTEIEEYLPMTWDWNDL